MLVKLERDLYMPNQILGSIKVFKEGRNLLCIKSLELPYKENARNISAIKEGIYRATREKHLKFGDCILIHGVPNRSGIYIHVGNYNYQIKGCILPGLSLEDLNNDNVLDVTNSRLALVLLMSFLPKSFNIKIC